MAIGKIGSVRIISVAYLLTFTGKIFVFGSIVISLSSLPTTIFVTFKLFIKIYNGKYIFSSVLTHQRRSRQQLMAKLLKKHLFIDHSSQVNRPYAFLSKTTETESVFISASTILVSCNRLQCFLHDTRIVKFLLLRTVLTFTTHKLSLVGRI